MYLAVHLAEKPQRTAVLRCRETVRDGSSDHLVQKRSEHGLIGSQMREVFDLENFLALES